MQSAPHEWLFPQCSVTVHHGGAGTTAAALRAGKPTVVTPCIADQPANAKMVAKLGAGVGLRQFGKVTPAELADALRKCVSDEALKTKAAELGAALKKEDGVATAVG